MESTVEKFDFYKNKKIMDVFLAPEEYKKMTDEELLEVLKKTENFDQLVFPNSWYKKFTLPEKKCLNTKEFIQESPWTKRAYHRYAGKIIDIPAQPGGNRPLLKGSEVPTQILIENNFSDKPEESTNQTVPLHLQDSPSK